MQPYVIGVECTISSCKCLPHRRALTLEPSPALLLLTEPCRLNVCSGRALPWAVEVLGLHSWPEKHSPADRFCPCVTLEEQRELAWSDTGISLDIQECRTKEISPRV